MQKRVVGLPKKTPGGTNDNDVWLNGHLAKENDLISISIIADPHRQACCLTAGTFSFLCQRKVLIQ